MFKKIANKLKGFFGSERVQMFCMMMIVGSVAVFAQNAAGNYEAGDTVAMLAQNSAGNYEAGTTALSTVTEEIAKYVPIVVKLCYAIAGVVAIVGAISVYIKMNNEEQDVKKSIMMIVGACIFLVAAAQALPLFFGL